ncbi:uncharacterized protein LOC113348048 [Papaver somniferum]|uniref:uncharacterized protein LOC113348048 n=1 Tax=Papaver somniferum TaxID=3469 RepID=UPI000E6FF1E2|nr:uncharacterized protein LOC113348048 [Papaver somniferum]
MGENTIDIDSQLQKLETYHPAEIKCYFSKEHKRNQISFEIMLLLMRDFEIAREQLEASVKNEEWLESNLLKLIVEKMSTSSGNNYDYYYSSSSSSSSDEDSKASVTKSKAKTTHDEGAKSSVPLNDRRVTYAELMKRKAEDDEAENRQRRSDRIRRRVQATEERRQYLDGVPSDSDADVYEEETAWVFTERKIKPDRYEREFRRTMKQIEAEAEAEEDSDSDDDPEARPDFIPDADSDEEEDNDDKSDDSDDEKDSDDESDNLDESDE